MPTDPTDAQIAAVGALELDLVQSIAEDRWRLTRARALECGIFALGQTGELEAENLVWAKVDEGLNQARTWLKDGKNLQLLALYEQRIHRAAEKNMADLRGLQAERKAARKQALEEAQLLAQLAFIKGEQYDAAKDFPAEAKIGSDFSIAGIYRQITQSQRLNEARYYQRRAIINFPDRLHLLTIMPQDPHCRVSPIGVVSNCLYRHQRRTSVRIWQTETSIWLPPLFRPFVFCGRVGGGNCNHVKPFWLSIWKKARSFTVSFVADLLKATLTLIGLSVFYGFIRLMALMGYSEEKLRLLEKVHYWGSYAVLAILTVQFVLRLAVSPFKGDDQ